MSLSKIFNSYFLELIFILILFIFFCYFYESFFFNFATTNYAYNELFINYHSGFIRRGLLGEIFFKLNSIFNLNHRLFFGFLFAVLYTMEIMLFYIILRKIRDFKILLIFIIFSPALLLFPIYDTNTYFVKDVFIKLSILIHAIIILYYNKDLEKYSIFLKYLILPLLFMNILFIHEYQILFISIHILFTLYFNNKNKIISKYNLKYYLILILPFILVTIFVGNINHYQNLNKFLIDYNIQIHQQIGLGFKGLFGGFYKWHFYYFSYRDFIQLLLSFFLSVFCFYLLFHYLIINKIIIIGDKIKRIYIPFFIPTLTIFLNTDHGRNLSLLSTHLVIFYLTLDFKINNLKIFIKRIKNNFLIINFIYIFIFIYLFLWTLPQNAGFGGKEQINNIFKSSIFSEVIKAIKFIYYFVDKNIIVLPEIKL